MVRPGGVEVWKVRLPLIRSSASELPQTAGETDVESFQICLELLRDIPIPTPPQTWDQHGVAGWKCHPCIEDL